MAFTLEITQTFRIMDGTRAAGRGQRTTDYRVGTIRLEGGTAHHKTVTTLSGGIVDQQVRIDPMGGSNPGVALFLQSDQALDLRFNSDSATPVCGVRQMLLNMTVSSLYVTVPGSTDAQLALDVVDGESVDTSRPLP